MEELLNYIILLLTVKISFNKIVIPFQTQIKLNDFENFNSTLFLKYGYNTLITDIELGEPIQKIKTCLSNNLYSFQFSDIKSDCDYYYNVSYSTSFINTTEKNQSYSSIVSGKETFYFYKDENYKNKEKIQNLTISLSQKISQTNIKYDYGTIGLLVYYPTGLNNNLIKELGNLKSQLNFINNYAWQIKNTNKDNYDFWQLIIGEYPHEYDSKNFKEENLISVLSSNYIDWKMKFREISSGNISFVNKLEIGFKFNNIHIIAPEEYRLNILKNFFFDYINQNICFEEKSSLGIIYCKKNSITQNDFEKFPKLKFYEINLNYTFEFNLNDLFIEKNEYYYFLIGFGSDWCFGLTFLKKYPLIFNHDSKAIYYYNNIVENNNSNDIFSTMTVKLIIGIGIAVIFLVIGLVAGKYFFNKNKKKKANELDDDYDYKPQNENNLNNEGLGVN